MTQHAIVRTETGMVTAVGPDPAPAALPDGWQAVAVPYGVTVKAGYTWTGQTFMTDTHAIVHSSTGRVTVVRADPAPATLPDGWTSVPVPVGMTVEEGFVWDGHTFVAWTQSLEQHRADLLTALGVRRWQAELAFTFGGAPIELNEITMTRIGDAVTGMQLEKAIDPDADPAVRWQVVPGMFIPIDMATMIALGLAAFRHVQACFAHAEALSIQIAAAQSLADLNAIDLDSGWPTT